MIMSCICSDSKKLARLQRDLSELLDLSQVPVSKIVKETEISTSHFYRLLRARSFTPEQLVKVYKSILKNSGYLMMKDKSV